MKKNAALAVIVLLCLFTACRQKKADPLYKDDDGNFLEIRCDKIKSCDDKNGLIIKVTAKDHDDPDKPDINTTEEYAFCCDTILSIIDTLNVYAKRITKYNEELKGKRKKEATAEVPDPYPGHGHEMYFTDSNRLQLNAVWLYSKETNDYGFTGTDFDIARKGVKLLISFNSEKTLKEFADKLKKAWQPCCM